MGFSPRPPAAADSIAVPTANNGYNVLQCKLVAALIATRGETPCRRAPAFRHFSQPPAGGPVPWQWESGPYRSHDTSTEGEATLLGIFSGCMKYGRDSGGGRMRV